MCGNSGRFVSFQYIQIIQACQTTIMKKAAHMLNKNQHMSRFPVHSFFLLFRPMHLFIRYPQLPARLTNFILLLLIANDVFQNLIPKYNMFYITGFKIHADTSLFPLLNRNLLIHFQNMIYQPFQQEIN